MPAESSLPSTFIVRVWRETSDGDSTWRGSADCVQSGERLYFQSLDQLKDAIARMIEESHRDNTPINGPSVP